MTFRKPNLQKNIERAIRFDRDDSGNGKPVLVVDPDKLEIEIFVRLVGSTSKPKSIGTFAASEIDIGED